MPITTTGWMSWGIASLYYLFETVLRIATGVMADDLRSSFGLISTELGFLASSYYYSYIALQVPCGMILDRLGIRNLLAISSFLCAGGAYLFAISPVISVAYLGRFLIGAGSACAFISCLKLAAGWFPSRYFALMAGVTNMMGCLGGVFAGDPVARHISHFGWRTTMQHMAICGLFIVLLCFFLIKDPQISDRRRDSISTWVSFLAVIRKSQIWLSGIIGGLMYVPVSVFAELWATPFLVTTYSISKEKASLVSMFLFIGMALGGPLIGHRAENKKAYRATLMGCILCVGLLFFAISAAQWVPFESLLFFAALAGSFMGGQVLVFTVSQYQASPETSATASAFTNSLVMFVGLLCQPFLGMLLDVFWSGAVDAEGLRIYSASTYGIAIVSLPLCFVTALGLVYFLKEPPHPSSAS